MKKIKTILFTIVISVVSILPQISPVYAIDIPRNSYYVKMQTQQLGEITAYVPYNQSGYFNRNDNTIISEYSSTIVLYGYGGGHDYQISFYPFGYQQTTYRVLQNNGIWATSQPLNITEIKETNLNLLSEINFSKMTDEFVLVSIIILMLFMQIIRKAR